jgi:uncharacterized protein YodC (DUF2158 family)
MSFLSKIQDRLNPITSTFKVGDAVRQVDEKQNMIVKGFQRAPHSKLPLIECEWYDAKEQSLRRNVFPQEALVAVE